MPASAAARHARHAGGVRAGHGVRVTGRVVAALVSVFLLAGMGYLHYSYASLDNGLQRVEVGGLGHAPAAAATGPSSSGVRQVDGPAQNLLLIGSDSRAGLSDREIKKLHVGAADATMSTDTLVVVHVPSDGSKATLISIPRDTYVDIPGFAKNKINAAYVDGYTYGTDGYPVDGSATPKQRQAAGTTLLIRVIKNLTGLDIDHYAMISFLGFYNIAKAIDGIDVDLCHAVDDTAAYNESHGEGVVGSGFKQSAGRHHLNAVQSLQFVRQRHNLVDAQGNQLNDVGREARQRYFLAAAFNKIESARTLVSPGKLNALIAAIKSTLTIDGGLSLENLAHQLLDLSSGHIVGQTIPTKGSKTFPGSVGDALVVDQDAVRRQVQAWVTQSASSTPSTNRTATSGNSSSANGPAGGTTSGRPSSSLQQAQSTSCIN